MNTQQSSRPVITPAMREQATKQPNSWLYVVDPIFTDPSVEVPPWGFIGGYRVDERGELTDDFSPNPHYRPSPVALRLPAPTNNLERTLQLTTTGYAQGQTLLAAMLDAELILFSQPQGSGLFTLEHESGRRQLQVFTSEAYLPQNWTTWQRMTGRVLASQPQLAGMDIQINPTSATKARIPGEDLIKAAGMAPPKVSGPAVQVNPNPAAAGAPGTGTAQTTAASSPAPAELAQPPAASSASAAQTSPSQAPFHHPAAPQPSTPLSTAEPAKQESTRPALTTPERSEPAPEFGVPAEAAREAAASDFGQRFLGSMLAAAIGDALGAAVESSSMEQIRSRYGDRGITEYDRSGEHPGEFTDDTQLTLFTLEGLIRGHLTSRKRGGQSPLPAIQLAYQRWLHTQGYAWNRAAGPFVGQHPKPTGWLIEQRDLFTVRCPDSTCITALRDFASHGTPGTFAHPINESDSCAGVVRATPVALWSSDLKEVFELAAATAALTHSGPKNYLPAGVQAVLVHRLVRAEPLDKALRTARELLAGHAGHEPIDQALQAAQDLATRGKPAPEQLIDTLGTGRSGHEALAIAVCATLSTDTTVAAVTLAVNHSGNSDSTGSICGALVGALRGSASLPGLLLRDLKQRDVIETLARDALAEFSDQSTMNESWLRKYPAERDTSELNFTSSLPPADKAAKPGYAAESTSSAQSDHTEGPHSASAEDSEPSRIRLAPIASPAGASFEEPSRPPQTLRLSQTVVPSSVSEKNGKTGKDGDRDSRILGTLLGGAVGDALGYPIEFDSIETIRRNHGQAGVRDFVDVRCHVSDDTQMTLFTLEGLIRASIRRRLYSETEPCAQVQQAYQRWLHTQGFDWKDAGGPLAGPAPDGWLIQQKEMFGRRSPGATCIQALHGYASGKETGSFTHRPNDSKGCGGVMRAAPAGFWSEDPGEVFRVGAMTAVLTHGHGSGFLPAGTLAVLVQQLLAGRSLLEAVDRGLTELSRWDGHDETAAVLWQAIEVATGGTPTPERINERLGQGWVGEEALGIAVCAALTHPESFSDAVQLAANHSGDSDSTAAICGNIMGAARTATAIPHKWRTGVELHEIIEQLAGDAAREFGHHPPTEAEWLERYPTEAGAAEIEPEAAKQEAASPTPAQDPQAESGPWPQTDPADEPSETSGMQRGTEQAESVGETEESAGETAAKPRSGTGASTHPAANVGPAAPGGDILDETAESATTQAESIPAGTDPDAPIAATRPPAATARVMPATPTDEVADKGVLEAEKTSGGGKSAKTAEAPAAASSEPTRSDRDRSGAVRAFTEPADVAPAGWETAHQSAETRTEAGTGPDAENGSGENDGLSEEELRLLAAWRKFRDGEESAPANLSQGLHKLLVEAFGAERAAQLVGDPGDTQEARELADESPILLSRGERLAGCVLGGAAGDALATAWMFTDLDAILRNNPNGIRQLTKCFGRTGAASHLAQQSAFVLEGLISAALHTRMEETEVNVPAMVHRSLQHWLSTQGARVELPSPPGALSRSEVLHAQRFPDEASLNALATFKEEMPTLATPPNAASTPTATARAAALGLHADMPSNAMLLGTEVAVLTHGHPDGYLPAGALAAMIAAVHSGCTLAESVETALAELELLEACAPVSQGLRSAVDSAKSSSISPAKLEELGHGWDAPSALAIAVAAALAHPDSFTDAVSLAATHSGNSAATAMVCGSLLGAARGADAIPREWLRELELREVFDTLLADERRIDAKLGTEQPTPDWATRYFG